MIKIDQLSKEELFNLILEVDPKEINSVCRSKNPRVREICNSDEFQKAYYPSGKDISDYDNEKLREITKNKVILTFGGCYCPPHKGHYDAIENVISLVKPDIVTISTTNSSSNPRHGVPLEHTIETWKDWGKILSKKYGVNIYVDSSKNDFDHNLKWRGASPETKMVINTVIYEKRKMPAKYLKEPLQKEDTSRLSKGYFEYVPRERFYEYHIKRTGDLSATNFVKCLKDFDKDCSKYVPDDVINKNKYIDNIRKKYEQQLK